MLCAESVNDENGSDTDCVTRGAPITCLGSSGGMVRFTDTHRLSTTGATDTPGIAG